MSRAGVLYINDSDIGWKPRFDSWLESHSQQNIQSLAKQGKQSNQVVFDDLIKSIFQKCQIYFENIDIIRLTHCLPVADMMMIETAFTILDSLLYQHQEILRTKKEEELKIIYEGIFIYAAMWGIGGTFLDSGEDEQFYNEF